MDVLRSEDRISAGLGKTLIVDVGKGLYYLHSMNLLHRDLKSLNVLVNLLIERLCLCIVSLAVILLDQ